MDIQNIAVKKIRILASVQPRDAIDEEVASGWAELLIEDPEFQMPAATAFQNPETQDVILSDGFTRLRAYMIAERHLMPVDVKEGDSEDAAWFAMFANGKHGRPLSQWERRAAIEKALSHRNRGEMTQEEIAKLFGVSLRTVATVASEHRKTGRNPQSPSENVQNCTSSVPTLSKGEKKERFSPEILEAIDKVGACLPNAKVAILNGSINKPEDELLAFAELDCETQVKLAQYFFSGGMSLKNALNTIAKRPTSDERPMREFLAYAQMHGTDQTFYFYDDTIEVFIGLLAQTPPEQITHTTTRQTVSVEDLI